MSSAALRWFLDDAKAQGLTPGQYERKYGIILPNGKYPNAAQARINRNEVSGGAMTDADFELAQHIEKRRAEARREDQDLLPPDDCE